MTSSLLAGPQHDRKRHQQKKQPTVRIVKQLSQSLSALSQISKKIAKTSKQKKSAIKSSKFAKVSRISQNLAKKVLVTVLKSIQKGSPKTALEKLSNLKHQFNRLNKAVQDIKTKPQQFRLKHTFQQVKRLRQLAAITLRSSAARKGRK